ncbi:MULTISPECIES: hypothetical protein [unclassified Roseateles]|uniref:hypothetical protein n=1 Tax=unclassified Roseateles TaxID=2626991 RepID=UPI0006F480BE|nr:MULTISPECIES: hypothetical protein [unclassified Roseateles]KQW51505.1 hypothetical protein ASC81_02380 [Pelomonas sp. Root405]KRA77738.1 hypothetical protein ASD88_02380 [Pelomonas sp. Root662]
MGSDARLSDKVLALVTQPPEPGCVQSPRAGDAAARAIDSAAKKAGLAAGALALPPGPLGWATILPEMTAVWHIQRQLVADIAALYGRSAELGPAQMMWCLFRHTAAQALRDLGVRVGERVVVRPAAQALLQKAASAVGVHLGKKAAGRVVSRWVPLVGAAGVGAYAYWDTRQVGRAAQQLFEREQVVDNEAR